MPAAGGKLPPNWREEVFQPSCQLPDRWLALFYKSTIALQSIGYMNHGCHKFTHNGRDVSYTRWTIKRARKSFYFSLQISPSLSFLCEVQSQSKTCKVVRISWVISSAIYSSTLIHCHVLQINQARWPSKETITCRTSHSGAKSPTRVSWTWCRWGRSPGWPRWNFKLSVFLFKSFFSNQLSIINHRISIYYSLLP